MEDHPKNNIDVVEDGAIVLSIPVPSLPRASSAPEFSALINGRSGSIRSNISHQSDISSIAEKGNVSSEAEKKKELTRSELLKSYRLHIFVCVIFIITVLSVSLSWYFKNEAKEKLYSSQAIFFNPRTRELTLSEKEDDANQLFMRDNKCGDFEMTFEAEDGARMCCDIDSSKSKTLKGMLGLDIPRWMLPLHCPIVMGDDPHRKECLWKRIAILRVTHFQNLDINCYNVSWESLGPKYVPHDCVYIDKAKWYGPSNQSENSFPIQGQFQYNPVNYMLNNNGLFNRVVDFYWLSSSGVAIYVDSNNPIQLSWNVSGSNQLCFQSNFSGSLYHTKNYLHHPVMNYTLCQGKDALKTHHFMQTMLAPKNSVPHPPDEMLQRPHWSLKNWNKTENVTQSSIINLAENVSNNSFKNSIITVDGNWQKSHGDLDFDEDRFSNVTEMIDRLQALGHLITLSVSPYFQYLSRNFHTGVRTNIFAKDAGGEVTGLTNFQDGLAAILDVFAGNGTRWYSEKLQNLTKSYQINSYRLTYGQQAWLPYKAHFEKRDATPNMYRKLATELFGALPDSSLVVEYTSDSRHVTSLLSVPTELSKDKKCLTGTIEAALTLGLMGYPFVMADGIIIGQDTSPEEGKPSRELYIRWLQLAHFFPAYQYTIPPWVYDDDVASIARNLSIKRKDILMKEMKSEELQLEVAKGYPILRPVWWLNSHNHSVHDMNIKDEFLIGNNFLVAPVLCEGIKERDVYIPPGLWEYMDRETIMLGPNVIRIYNLTLNSNIIFHRRPLAGEIQSNVEL